MRVGTVDHLAVHFEDQTQHAVRRRVLRPEIQRMAVDFDRLGDRVDGRPIPHIDLAHRVSPPDALSRPPEASSWPPRER